MRTININLILTFLIDAAKPRCLRNSSAYILHSSHLLFPHRHKMQWDADVLVASLLLHKRDFVVLAAFERVIIPARVPRSAWVDSRLQ